MDSKSSNTFRLRADGNTFTLMNVASQAENSPDIDNDIKITNANSTSNQFCVQKSSFAKFDTFFERFDREISSMHLQQKQIDKFYMLCEDLIVNSFDLYNSDACIDDDKPPESVSIKKNHIVKKLKANQSLSKRRSCIKSDHQYVAPKAVPIGLKWKSQNEAGNDVVNYKLIQTKFQYVSIIQTIAAMFENPEFKKMYFEYNESLKHTCIDGTYRDFCCGSNSKKIKAFDSKNTLQIQLGIDDFEPCNALKSRAGIHKMTGIYFQLRNIPEYCRSKLSNILLIAIVKVADVTNKEVFGDVYECIINELRFLETTGISLSPDINLKGVLINISFDNLGGNFILGITESFNSNFCCRICECSKAERHIEVCENPEKMRGRKSYSGYLKIIEKNNDFDLNDTKGIVRYCPFNELQYFHIFDNLSVDIMHDMNEGVIPHFLTKFFNSLISSTSLKFDVLNAKVRDFNYGLLNKMYSPSNINLKKHSLGQSARQIYNVMIHVPFIFSEYKSDIPDLWNAMENLL